MKQTIDYLNFCHVCGFIVDDNELNPDPENEGDMICETCREEREIQDKLSFNYD